MHSDAARPGGHWVPTLQSGFDAVNASLLPLFPA
jgi:hypothetical protein